MVYLGSWSELTKLKKLKKRPPILVNKVTLGEETVSNSIHNRNNRLLQNRQKPGLFQSIYSSRIEKSL